MKLFFFGGLYVLTFLAALKCFQIVWNASGIAPLPFLVILSIIGVCLLFSIAIDIFKIRFTCVAWARKVVVLYYTSVMILMEFMSWGATINDLHPIFCWGVDYPISYFLSHWFLCLIFTTYLTVYFKYCYPLKWTVWAISLVAAQFVLGLFIGLTPYWFFLQIIYWPLSYSLFLLLYAIALIQIWKLPRFVVR